MWVPRSCRWPGGVVGSKEAFLRGVAGTADINTMRAVTNWSQLAATRKIRQ
jgi:hypothetical protein